jgi:ABC-type branched-subunit amino acid transport system substrate-binding protein
MQRSRVRRVGALIAGLALVAAACGDDDDDSGGAGTGATSGSAPSETTGAPVTTGGTETTAAGGTETTAAGGTETTAAGGTETTAAGGTETTGGGGGGGSGELAGLKGTTPLVELSADFTDRLLEIDPSLGTTFNYAAETYDAITIIALAVAEAGDDGIAYAEHINGITRGGEKCDSFETCLAIIDAGGDPDYDGFSGPIEFSGNGEPLQASYGLLTFGDDNRIDDAITEYIPATAPASADVPDTPVEGNRKGDGTLTIGSILPQTGSLAFLGPPEFAAFNLAIQDINAAGGVLGQDIVGIEGDSGDATTDTANQTVDRLLSQDVDAIVGAASSGVSLTVIDKITGAGVVQFSPANTSKELSDYPDKGLYFRTAPSDILQGATLGEVIAGDGIATVVIVARNDSYGTGLAEDSAKALEEAGVEVVETKIYAEDAQTFDAEVAAIKAANPEAVLLIAFDEASKILTKMVEQGVGPKDLAVYGTDGFIGNSVGENFDAGK